MPTFFISPFLSSSSSRDSCSRIFSRSASRWTNVLIGETLYRQCCLDLHAVVNFLPLAVRHEAPANPNAAGGNMDVAAQPIWPWPPIASTNCNIKTNKPRLPHQRSRPNAAVDSNYHQRCRCRLYSNMATPSTSTASGTTSPDTSVDLPPDIPSTHRVLAGPTFESIDAFMTALND